MSRLNARMALESWYLEARNGPENWDLKDSVERANATFGSLLSLADTMDPLGDRDAANWIRETIAMGLQ